jgi:hypothetical protein
LPKQIHKLLHWGKVVHKFALLLSLKLPNVNNHPMDEYSLNLVTLLSSLFVYLVKCCLKSVEFDP